MLLIPRQGSPRRTTRSNSGCRVRRTDGLCREPIGNVWRRPLFVLVPRSRLAIYVPSRRTDAAAVCDVVRRNVAKNAGRGNLPRCSCSFGEARAWLFPSTRGAAIAAPVIFAQMSHSTGSGMNRAKPAKSLHTTPWEYQDGCVNYFATSSGERLWLRPQWAQSIIVTCAIGSAFRTSSPKACRVSERADALQLCYRSCAAANPGRRVALSRR